jgi:hypothetical protein
VGIEENNTHLINVVKKAKQMACWFKKQMKWLISLMNAMLSFGASHDAFKQPHLPLPGL